MNMSYELNNLQKDTDIFNGKFNKHSPIVEIFSAMVNGESLSKFGKKADRAVDYIKDLGMRAENGDISAVSELNTLRRFVVEAPVLEEAKLLGVFGSYQNVGFDETVEREVYDYAGEHSRIQAAGGDVVYPTITKKVYPVPTFTVSGGYVMDYRRVALGDMAHENEGLTRVKTDILNRALLAIVKKVYDAITTATGVKYDLEASSLQKVAVDALLNKVRRIGRPTVIGDYAVISQFNNFAGYKATVGSSDILGVSQKLLDEIAANGFLSVYNGTILAEMPNPYNYTVLDSTGTNFATLLPAGLAFVVPSGVDTPIATFTRGGVTSFTGNNVKTGKVETRFDLEVGVDVAKGQEYKVGIIYDTSIGGLV